MLVPYLAAIALHPMHNGGTPPGIPAKTDCRLRQFAWEVRPPPPRPRRPPASWL